MKNISLRPATIEDAQTILAWRNDPISRENSFSSDEISLEEHMMWMQKKLSDETCQMYLMSDGGEDVGQIRIDIIGQVGEISYLIAPKYRGKGYGTDIIEQYEKHADDRLSVLVGLVKSGNEASKRCFEKNSYIRLSGNGTDCYMKLINQ